ncbi:MAG: thioredoxin-disulfide reductase [Candidatus Marinimicrobia bacterium]|nr:thioredoxin-disulfide reductase [Gammaproteobacteria bacterium]MBL6911795.1 thioredoxin-disulfide reductase [Candidatus Neomarinimicrobiota bacterium]MBT3728210.1 thioredoxin-disulfide reductase [Candidatus Neomarinimicrobiota bacterium]MBT3944105.1 thioredoxin-disulfide reductase [Candidatus Neomarinimicrobiota bacterium]MBT4112106.1 thioredoxin-disulfide reductase [Candidatus Neomarinimicrobiota bacterium]
MHKTIIIGSGPAGLTAAIYAARANLNPIVFEGNQPGGQLTITTDVENYPGFPDGVLGPDMMDLFRKQAQRFGAECFYKYVSKVDFSSSPFKVYVQDEEYLAESVIISTGASARMLGLEAEKELMGYGVSTCATCDGYFFKDKEIVVVGGGDSAMEEASFLTKFASKVTLIHRRDEFRASKIMIDRVLDNPKIEIIKNAVVADIFGSQKDGVSGILLKDTIDGNERNFDCEGVFYGIGHKPNTDQFKGIIDLDDQGYITTNPGSTLTNVAGIFACGDVQDSHYRQAITAAGSGCMAAIDAEKYLEDL